MLLGLFFVTVGMSLDLRVVADNIGWVVALLVVPVAAKLALIVYLAHWLARRGSRGTGFWSPRVRGIRSRCRSRWKPDE